MSRHAIPAINPKYSIVVGYDNPMRTLFANVRDEEIEALIDNDPEAVDDPIIFSLGQRYDEIKTVEELKGLIASYAVIQPEILDQLQSDLEAGASHIQSPLQRWGEQISRQLDT